MSDPAGGGFFGQLLGDLLQFMGGASGTDRLELARGLAQGVAAEGRPEANVDPVERIRLEELVRVAELHVAELTGLSPTPGGVAVGVEAVGPGTWARRTVDDWGFVLDVMTVTPPAPPPAPGGEGAGTEDPGDLLARLMSTMGPVFAALQLGSAVGHLARTTLGQYELPVPRAAPGLMLVPANILRFAEDWSLPADEVRLWVCLRELTVHAVVGRAHVRERLQELLRDVVRGMAADAGGLMEQLQGLDPSDPDSLQRVLGDPEALLAGTASPEREQAAAQLMAVVRVLLGYVEHVLDLSATRLLGGRGALAEAWRRRQVDRESPARTAEALFGLDLGPAEVARGVAFVDGVVARAGEEGLARLWESARTLPTPAEVDAPGLWLERISFEDPADG
ncbi:MAG: zinc-dependent metalloprotease [Acidobacteriota bacterium]|nr:zinc-dependent metalloprotease [Acidobacteriota bacterium]